MVGIRKTVHIDSIRAGDTVEHAGSVVTVTGRDLKYSAFIGVTLFGDSYRCGQIPVKKVFWPTTYSGRVS